MLLREISCKLSTANLLHNVGIIKARAPDSKIIAMVKSDGYGHGMRGVAEHLDGHVDALGVSSIDEAMALLGAGIKTPVALVYGVFSLEKLRLAFENGFIVTFHSKEQIGWLKELEREKKAFPKKIQAFLGLETGMEREGFHPEEAEEPFKALSESPLIQQPVGIQSHFACADEPEDKQNKKQIEAFAAFTKEHRGPRSFCNSAAIFAFPEQQHEWVRPGLALYGVSPLNDKSAESLELKPVMTLQSKLVDIREVKKGECIGYGGKYRCPEDMRVGSVPIGYGDGYLHAGSLQETRSVLVNGKRCPLVGPVSMNTINVDLRGCSDAALDDVVTLWGERLSIKEVANAVDKIPYEVLTNRAHGIRTELKWYNEIPPTIETESAKNDVVSAFSQNAPEPQAKEAPREESNITSEFISIRGISKHTLFAALYNRAKSLNSSSSFDLRDYSFSAHMTPDLAKQIIEKRGLFFNETSKDAATDEDRPNTIGDRVLKFSLEGTILYTRDYDARNGRGAAASVIRALRDGRSPPENKDNAEAIDLYSKQLSETATRLFMMDGQDREDAYRFSNGRFFTKEERAKGSPHRFTEILNGTLKAYGQINLRRMTLGGIEKAFLAQIEALLDYDEGGCKSKMLALYELCGKDFIRTAAVISVWNREEEEKEDYAWTKDHALKACLNVLESGLAPEDIRNAVETYLDIGQADLSADDIDTIIRITQFKIPEFSGIVQTALPRSEDVRKKERSLKRQ